MEQILTERQQAALRLIADEPKLSDYYLTGGTALVGYYLHHRRSDDLDFLPLAQTLKRDVIAE